MKSSRRDSIYIFWSGAILLCSLIAVFALLFASFTRGTPQMQEEVLPSQTLAPTASPVPTIAPSQNPSDPNEPEVPVVAPVGARLAETADMGQEYVDKFVFLGDSTTYGLAYYDIVDDTRVWTPSNGTLTLTLWETALINYVAEGTEISISDCLLKAKPEYMLITLGCNGVSFLTEEKFVSYYTGLINKIKEVSPDTKIIVNNIYPVTEFYSVQGIDNPRIDAANVWIEKMANDLGIKYLASNEILKDANGNLNEAYDNGDEIHLNGETYKTVINYLRTHGYE